MINFSKKPNEKSYILNSVLVTRKNMEGKYLFEFSKKDGRAIVRLDKYLVCPIEMFTPRQIKMAIKKYGAKEIKEKLDE